MFDSKSDEPVTRPANCPFCHSRAVDTLAKILRATTYWRCRECEGTWTIASQQPVPTRPR